MPEDVEDEYFLGDGADDEPADDRRTRRGALIGLAVVVVLVAVAITLTSLLVDTSSSASGPRTAAQQWGTALVHGDTATRRHVECAKGSPTAAVVRLTLADATGVSTGGARKIASNTWSVPVDFDGPDGSLQDSVSVTVVRESGRYLVC